jgi:hypothetical protein
MCAKERAFASILFQKTLNCHSDELSLIPAGQLLGRIFDEINNIRTINSNHMRHSFII